MSDIRPIETRYKGYRFRSRLEARWAVFFETLSVPWEYEAEGFELGDGLRWLPDFIVGDRRVPFEIKPNGIPGDAYRKVDRFVSLTGRPAFVLSGAPWICTKHGWRCEECQCHSIGCCDSLWYADWLIDEENPTGFFVIGNPRFATGRRDPKTFLILSDPEETVKQWTINSGSDDGERYPLVYSDELIRACVAARSARFEHGEAPA